MKVSELMREDLICTDLSETTKEGVLRALVDHLVDRGVIENGDEVLRLLLEREQLMTTGVRTGFAIPHVFPERLGHTVVALGYVAAGVDWQALDQEPVRYVFLILGSPQAAAAHLRLLARLSRLLTNADFIHRLDQSKTPAEMLQAVTISENEPPTPDQTSGAQGA
jgi:fructose-specific phosphotransferase system IIA component